MWEWSPQTSGQIPDPRLPGARRMSCGWEARLTARKERGVCLLGTPPCRPESERAASSPCRSKGQAVTAGPGWAPAWPQAHHPGDGGCLQTQLAGKGGRTLGEVSLYLHLGTGVGTLHSAEVQSELQKRGAPHLRLLPHAHAPTAGWRRRAHASRPGTPQPGGSQGRAPQPWDPRRPSAGTV